MNMVKVSFVPLGGARGQSIFIFDWLLTNEHILVVEISGRKEKWK